jgi:hypothetical protein
LPSGSVKVKDIFSQLTSMPTSRTMRAHVLMRRPKAA